MEPDFCIGPRTHVGLSKALIPRAVSGFEVWGFGFRTVLLPPKQTRVEGGLLGFGVDGCLRASGLVKGYTGTLTLWTTTKPI